MGVKSPLRSQPVLSAIAWLQQLPGHLPRPRIIATAWEFVLSFIGLRQQSSHVRTQALLRLRAEDFGRRYERLLRWVWLVADVRQESSAGSRQSCREPQGDHLYGTSENSSGRQEVWASANERLREVGPRTGVAERSSAPEIRGNSSDPVIGLQPENGQTGESRPELSGIQEIRDRQNV